MTLVLGSAAAVGAAAGTTRSLGYGEFQGGQPPAPVSGDGRFVAFTIVRCSHGDCAANAVVADRQQGKFAEVCFSGLQAEPQAISRNGRFVLCASDAGTQSGDPQSDVSVADPQTGKETAVAVAADGGEPDGDFNADALAAGGRFAVFIRCDQPRARRRQRQGGRLRA